MSCCAASDVCALCMCLKAHLQSIALFMCLKGYLRSIALSIPQKGLLQSIAAVLHLCACKALQLCPVHVPEGTPAKHRSCAKCLNFNILHAQQL